MQIANNSIKLNNYLPLSDHDGKLMNAIKSEVHDVSSVSYQVRVRYVETGKNLLHYRRGEQDPLLRTSWRDHFPLSMSFHQL